MKPGIAKVATISATLLAILAGGAAAYVFITDWSHGDEPMIAAVLLLGVFFQCAASAWPPSRRSASVIDSPGRSQRSTRFCSSPTFRASASSDTIG